MKMSSVWWDMKSPSKRQIVLAMDMGTFCDNRLMESALEEVKKKYDVVYFTDKNHRLDKQYYIKEYFDTPSFVSKDPTLSAADTESSFLWWVVQHPGHAIEAYQWSVQVRDKVTAILEKYKPICVLLLYPALPMVWLFNTTIPIYVLYYAPGILSYSLPWLFSSSMKDPEYTSLYVKDKRHLQSGLDYVQRISQYSNQGSNSAGRGGFGVYKNLKHLLCWDGNMLPTLEFPQKSHLRLDVQHVGPLLTPELSITRKASSGANSMKKLLTDKSYKIFVSFGTYGNANEVVPALELLLIQLNEFCDKHNGVVIYHNGTSLMNSHIHANKLNRIKVWNGFVLYEDVIPCMDIVIFTGSCCLQNICLYHRKPMMFMPILNEQFFWAKNYFYHTGVPYIDSRTYFFLRDYNAFDFIMRKAVEPHSYITKVSKSMRKHPGKAAAKLCEIVDSIV
jgi:hypothetical protein